MMPRILNEMLVIIFPHAIIVSYGGGGEPPKPEIQVVKRIKGTWKKSKTTTF